MTNLSFRPKGGLKTRISPQIWGRVRLSDFMGLREDEFRKLVRGVEMDPIFRKLSSLENFREKVISRRPFPNTDLAKQYYEIDERTMAGGGAPEIAPLLEKHKEMLSRIRQIGMNNFKRFFLNEESKMDVEEIARECAVTPVVVKEIRTIVDDFCLLELAHPSPPLAPAAPASRGTKVASIEKSGGSGSKPGEYRIRYLSSHYARGRYTVDYKKLYELKARGTFAKGEFGRIKRLIRDLELINMRQATLYNIIRRIVEVQTPYFDTRDEDDLSPLTQAALAGHLGVHRSTVNRAIHDKSLETPWGEEKPMRSFLRNQKWVAKRRLGRVLKDSKPGASDKTIMAILKDEYDIRLARRTICAYRHEIDGNERACGIHRDS